MPAINITINVPDEVVAAINTWRSTQLLPDGITPKYATNQILLRSIIHESVKNILKASPTATISAAQDRIATQRAIITTAEDGAVS